MPDDKHATVKGTGRILQIFNGSVNEQGFYHRMFSCPCESCHYGKYAECLFLASTCSSCQQLFTCKWHNFTIESANKSPGSDSDESDDEVFFTKTEASLLIKTNNITVIKASDNCPYYLLKLTCEPYTTETNEKDDCNHTSLINHKVVKGHYLEVFKEMKDGNICYLEVPKTAIISGFSVVGICPELEIFQMKRRRKMTSMSLVNNDIHEALCTLVLKDV